MQTSKGQQPIVISKSNKPNKKYMAKQGSKTTYSITPLAGVETKFQLSLLVVYVKRVLAVCWLLLVLGRRTAQARARCDQIDAASRSSCELDSTQQDPTRPRACEDCRQRFPWRVRRTQSRAPATARPRFRLALVLRSCRR
jgi:hypothetical protein